MRKVFSPAFFVFAVALFFLPFVTVSCNADALQGFGEGFAEGLGEGAIPGDLPQGDFEILSATGWQIVTNSADVSEEASSLGGGTAGSSESGDLGEVQPFAIAAFGLAVLGIFLSLLRAKAGPALALVLGVGGAAALFFMKNKFEGGGGGALGAAGLDISWKPAFWAAIGLLGAAGVAGLMGLVTGGGAPAMPGMPGLPPAPGTMPAETGMPPPAPPAGGSSPPPPSPPPSPPPAEPMT